MLPPLPASTRLSHSGTLAELSRDELTENGVVLCIDGAEQSHVELGDPEFLLHDYLRRMRSVLTALDPAAASVLHLGAGALTLPRWIAHWRPAAHQTVVDIEPELVGFVLEHLPLDPAPENVVADAAQVLTPGGALAGRAFEVAVVDLFNSSAAPAALSSSEFFASVWNALTPGGLMLVNFGDEADMGFARTLTTTLLQAVEDDDAASSLLSAPADVLAAQAEGNLVFAAARRGFTEPQLAQIWAAGPHPGDVLSGDELRAWCWAA
ncbi:spermidine synthase [Nesterenkonia muleiensis]|uniref:spermidine synthase n=1 Tax=Nesterenkonia muleiensis TaxID=2282648 RepID=UPI0013004B73|nr:fused MFS/spermidine synthase [Nesterenkonia muleiensis]